MCFYFSLGRLHIIRLQHLFRKKHKMYHVILLSLAIISASVVKCKELVELSPNCIDDYNFEMLMMHNKLRRLHLNTLDLNENRTLKSIAKDFSEYLAKNELFEHSRQQNLGENLAFTWSSNLLDLTDCKSNKKY